MTSERWQQVKEALTAALSRQAEERGAYLTTLRAENADVAREVESLLEHETDRAFLEQPILPPPLSLGTSFGPYLLQSMLGEGGMGVVYLAQDSTLERPVALKFLSRGLEHQEDARRRFLREAKAAAALDHPYICKIYQTGERDGHPFIAMEYVRGETLRQRLDAGPLPLKDALWITLEVAEALETAHAAQIVHRDLKPSNIMLTADGHVKVLDFGLAKRVDADPDYAKTGSVLTDNGTVLGTVAYMSPEQVRGQDVDLRSDLFSLGVLLYECVAGRNPFLAGSSLETASEILHRDPPLLRPSRADVPPLFDEVLQRLLAKTPDERYASTADLRRDLVRVREQVELGVEPQPLPRPAPERRIARRIVVGSLATAVLLAVAGAWLWAGRTAGAAPTPMSVAVLPFSTTGGDEVPRYYATGLPREVITRLAGAGLRVTPWETAQQFHETSNPVEVAKRLGVTSVLSGSLHSVGAILKVTVSLVDGASGQGLWTQAFDVDDAREVQTKISQGIAKALGYDLTGSVGALLARTESSNRDAWDFYLQGADYLTNIDREGTGVALAWFEKALGLDPNLVDAYVGVGAVHFERYWNGWGGGAHNLTLAAQSLEEALSRDPKNMRAWRGRMLIEFYRGHGRTALELAVQAARGGRQDIETLLARAEAFALNGPSDVAQPLLDRVIALDPSNQTAAWLRTITFYRTGQLRKTADAAAEYARRFDDDAFVAMLGASALEQLHDLKGASARLERVVARLIDPALEPGAATAYDLVALLAAGVIAHESDQKERAHSLWQRGLELTRQGLQIDAEAVGLNVFLATFLGFTDEPSFASEAARTMASLKADRLNPWELVYLAGAYAYRGETKAAVDVLRDVVTNGRLLSRAFSTVVAPSLRGTSALNEILSRNDAEEAERRRLYGDAS